MLWEGEKTLLDNIYKYKNIPNGLIITLQNEFQMAVQTKRSSKVRFPNIMQGCLNFPKLGQQQVLRKNKRSNAYNTFSEGPGSWEEYKWGWEHVLKKEYNPLST